MSYTAIPPQDRAMKLSCNGYAKRCTIQSERDSSLKSPPSIQRRVSCSIVQNSTALRKSAPEHQEIYEGFTFLDEQRRKGIDFCSVNCCPRILESYHSTSAFLNVFKCGQESINPFSFKDGNLERIYYKYFSLVYRSSQLSKFFLLTTIFCLTLFLTELVVTIVSESSVIDNVRCCIFLGLFVLTCVPLAHIHCQRCMRPQHMGALKLVGLIVCCAILIGVSPIWGKFTTDSPSFLTVGLWETMWLILLISCFYPITFYTLLALTIFLCISHSIISILVILLSNHTTFSPSHWAALCGNWMLFMSTILLGCVISYLQQKMLRNAFLHAREFLNSCVQAKVANEKLDRLLSCIVPQPILPELKQAMLSLDQRDQLPSVVHLRNVSFINVEICGLSRGVKCENNGSNFSTDAVKLMNELFSRFDMLGQELGCYRVRVHPDDYLSLAGYPETRVDHAKSCTELAFRIQQTIKQLCDSAEIQLEVRTIVHTGVTYGAMLGSSRMIFDLLGDDIRVLRYMLAVATPGKVMVSKLTYDQLPDGYKGDSGPSLDIPIMSMSMSASGDCNRLETVYLRPRHNKQSSLLTEVNMIISEPGEKVHEDIEARLARVYPLLSNLSDGCEDNVKQGQRPVAYVQIGRQSDKEVEKGDGHLSRSGQSDSLSSSTNHLTKSSALNKLAQAAKFNANIPYYFLSDETFFLSTPDDDRLLLDIGGGYITSTITGSPIFHGTTKSSASWKSTLRSQLTQSLIGSYVIDEMDISMKRRPDNDLSISKFTGAFNNASLELKFQNYSESYMGFALLTCLSTILFMTGVHAMLLARTVMLLLIFLVVFIWIGLSLLLILLAKMKCISADVIKSRLSCIIVISITVLGIFTLFATNSFCCLNEPTSHRNQTNKLRATTIVSQKQTEIPTDDNLRCKLPIYIPLTTVWISLPLICMMMLPEIVKFVVITCSFTCTSIIIFSTHDTMFTAFSKAYRADGIPIKYILGITMQLLFAILILLMSRILNSFRRLVFQWHVKTEIKRDQCAKLSATADQAVDILLPKFVSSYFMHPSQNYMNMYASEHNVMAVLSVSIPSWCPIGVTEPSDVANNIRVLNQILISFDKLIMQPEFESITKIRTAGETAWYAVGVDYNNQLNNQLERSHSMICLLHAAEMMKRIVDEHNSKNPYCSFVLRIGIHSGCGFSGVVGGSNPEYGVWGEAYFGATIIQRCGQLDKIHLSSNFMSEIDSAMKYSFYDMGTLSFNNIGQLVSLPPGQWAHNTTTLRVFVLREKSPSYSSATSNCVVPYSSDEMAFPISVRRNSLSVMAGMDHFNPYMLSSGPFMQANIVANPPVMFTAQPNTKSHEIYNSPSNTKMPEIPVNIIPVVAPMTMTPIVSPILPQVTIQQLTSAPPNGPTIVKSHQEVANRKSISEGRSRIHHYRNLATELPDSIIPPSPPPHRRTYFSNNNEDHYSPPGVPPRYNQGNNMSMSDNQRIYDKPVYKEATKMTQSAISPSEDRNLRPPKCVTPSSSMDSFLELEKACTTNPRTKCSNYSYPPNERLSLIPEAYKHMKDMNKFEDESMLDMDLDKASMDVMATSCNKNFEMDEMDIMSHHNPIYTDNEYESMAESQVNLLDPIEEIRRSRIVNLRSGNNRPGTVPILNSVICKPQENSFDFPDYKRPSSPTAGTNGDDSDHLSKRNRNSSNSRDSSSIAARRSGGLTSSDESGHKKHRKMKSDDSDKNSTDGPTNQCESSGMDMFSIRQQKSLIEDSYKADRLPLSMQCTIPTRDTTTDGYNGSPCTSLVTDMGWTSCDDEEAYSDYPGYASKDKAYEHRNGHGPSKWSESNDQLVSHNHFDEDDSDIDCMRFHSDLISDFSENPLVSDLDNETDYEARSSDLGVLSSINEGRINPFYKFPSNNRFNNDFLGQRGYVIRSENGVDGMYSEDDEVNDRRIFASHPWNQMQTGSLPQGMEDSIYTQPPLNNNDDQSSVSSNILSRTSNEAKTSSRLPEIAPVRMPDFNSSNIHRGMGRDVVRETPVSRFVQKQARYNSSSPERSEYDNVSDKNSLQGNWNGKIVLRDRISHDSSRYNNADDSDAMSGYVGDVASSVYDSDDYEEGHDRRFTQVYLDYDVNHGDPMAPFFPRLPPVKTDEKVDNNSHSGSASASGIRSDYDNVDSDKPPEQGQVGVNGTSNGYSGKATKCDENYQKQIAAEARRISLVFRNQWSNDLRHTAADSTNSSLDSPDPEPKKSEANKQTPSKSFVLHSRHETSADSEHSSINCHSYAEATTAKGDAPLPLRADSVPKSRSTDCLMSPLSHCAKSTPSANGDPSGGQRDSKNLSKFLRSAERVKSLLPSELHQYILPGCISSSSLNSCSDRDSLAEDLKVTQIADMKTKAQRRHFSDEERSLQPL